MAISIYQLKPRFVALLRPCTARLHAHGTTANHITLLAAALSVLLGTALCVFPHIAWLWLLLPLWLFLRMALNAIDGILAREFNQKSRLGGLLNECGDIVADAALFLPFAFVPGVWGWAVALFIWLALATEFCGVLALLIGAQRRYDGPMGKSDRAFCTGLGALLVWASLHYGIACATPISIGLVAGCALMLLTAYNRMRQALNTPQTSTQ